MSQTLEKEKVFIITYDDGDDTQTLRVPHYVYQDEEELFQKNIIVMKCMSCNFESHFDCVEKEVNVIE